MTVYAVIRDYKEPTSADMPAIWNIDFDACQVINGIAGVVQLRAMNDIEARAGFEAHMRGRGHNVKWVKSLDDAWSRING